MGGGGKLDDKFSEKKGDMTQHPAARFLLAFNKKVGATKAVWVCAWGKEGAFALDTKTGKLHHEPVHKQKQVVDSVGAGDTFNAACLHAKLRGADVPGMLRCGCAVAGRKVSQKGFEGL